MNITELTPSQLRQAADLQEQIAGLQTQLAGIISVGGKTPIPAQATKPAKKKGGMSAAGRAKVAAAQKARWAKIKAAKPAAKSVAAKPVKKGGMSAAGRARIVAAQKARWPKINAAKVKPVAAPTTAAKSVPATKPVSAPKPAKKKGTISPEGIARIKAAQKARWAKIRAAAGKKRL
jgi:hypothetical protein